jgi:uncharacterized protein YbjT (DUF2867 family)
MRVMLTGASGMVGKGVLYECLDAPDVEEVLCLGRGPSGMSHPKVKDLVLSDLSDYAAVEGQLEGYDACFFCLGVSSAGMSEAAYTKITYDLTMALARTLVRLRPAMTFIYVSGAGTDTTGKGVMWARVKGRVENELHALGFKQAVMFRPGLIRPMRGIVSRTKVYRAVYAVMKPLIPALNAVAPRLITDTDRVGKAMLRVARAGTTKEFLTTADINELARER